MKIHFNGIAIETAATTLVDLLLEQGFSADSHVATAVNGTFVAKIVRHQQVLSEDDSVEVVAPMQGG